MFLIELFGVQLAESLLKLPQGSPWEVYVTNAFLSDYQEWMVDRPYTGKDLKKRLAQFLEFKRENGMRPFGPKDGPLGNHHVIPGLWRYHLDHGKVILVYAPAETHVELYMIGDHNTIEGGSSTRNIGSRLGNLTPKDLKPWAMNQPESQQPQIEFTDDELNDIATWVFALLDIPQDREALQQFANDQTGFFLAFLMGWIKETKPGTNPEMALEVFFQQYRARRGVPFARFVANALR